MATLETYNLTKTFGNIVAVNRLNISVNEHDIFGFLGPNGAGKTTTIKMLCGLLKPTGGSASVAGFDIRNDSVKIRNILGIVPEAPRFYEDMSGRGFLTYFAKLHRIPSKERKSRIKDVLEITGIADVRNRKIGTYSHGMRRRLSIAKAMLNNPEILLLDEPTAGLDPPAQVAIRRLIKRSQTTIFISSHNLYEIEELCNRVAIIDKGKLIACDRIENLKHMIGGETIEVKLREVNNNLIKALKGLRCVRGVKQDNRSIFVNVTDAEKDAPDVARVIIEADGDLIKLDRAPLSLYDVFVKLTREDVK